MWVDHLIPGETAKCRQERRPSAETKAGQGLFHVTFSRYSDGRMQVPSNCIKRAITFGFMRKNERIKYNFRSHLIEPKLSRRLAGAKVVVAGDEKKLNILIRPTPLVDQPVELGVVFNSAMNQIAEKEQPVRV